MSKTQKTMIGIVAATTLVGTQANVLTNLSQKQNNTTLYVNNTHKKVYNKTNEDVKDNHSKVINQNENIVNKSCGFAAVQPPKNLNYNNDLEVQLGNITYSNPSNGGPSNYVPSNTQGDNPLIMVNDSKLTVNVPFSLRSKGGYSYSIKSVSLSANIQGYQLNGSSDAKDITENLIPDSKVNSLELYTSGEATNLNSASTGVLSCTFEDEGSFWKQAYKLGMSLVVTLSNGDVITVPVNTGLVRTTGKGNWEVSPSLENYKPDGSNKYIVPLQIQGLVGEPIFWNGKFSLGNYVTAIRYKVNFKAENGSTVSFPNLPDWATYDSKTQIITVNTSKFSGNNGMNTLNAVVDVKGTSGYNATLQVTPIGFDYDSQKIQNLDYCNTSDFTPSNVVSLPYSPVGKLSITTNDLPATTGEYAGNPSGIDPYSMYPTQASTILNGELPVDCKVYTIQTFQNQALEFDKANADGYYCYFPDIEGSSQTISTQEVQDIAEGKCKVYTGEELNKMIEAGESVPKLNVMFTYKTIKAGNVNTTISTAIGNSYTEDLDDSDNNTAITYIIPNSSDKSALKEFTNYLNKFQGPGDTVLTGNDGLATGLIQSMDSSGTPYCSYGGNNNPTYSEEQQYNSTQFNPGIFGDNGDVITDTNSGNNVHISIQNLLPQYYTELNLNTGNTILLPKGSQLSVHVGPNFNVTKAPTFGNIPCQYKLEGENLILTVPDNFEYTCTEQPINNAPTGVNIYGNYTVFKTTNVNIDAQYIMPKGSPYVNPCKIKLNNKYVLMDSIMNDQYNANPMPLTIYAQTTNDCAHEATPITNNQSSLKDIVYNRENQTDSFMIYGRVPSNTSGVPLEDNYTNTGNFTNELNSISANGDVYILTKSELNSLDKEMLTNYNNANTKEYVNNVKTTWTKYNGTMPKNAIGYVVFTNIGAQQQTEINYGLTFGNLSPYDIIYSGFGYVNLTDNLNTTSNIIKLKVDGFNGQVNVKVEGPQGFDIPKNLTSLDTDYQPLVFKNQQTSPIPSDILSNLNNAETNNVFENDHVKIDYCTFNGKKVSYKDLVSGNLEGIDYKGNNNIVIHVSPEPKYTISSEMITQDGKVLVNPELDAKGYTGTSENIKELKIPEGYKLVKMEIGNKTITSLPNKIGDSDILVKYIVAPIPKKTVTVKLYINGKPYKTIQTTTGYEGSPLKLETPTWNKELYKLESISENNKVITENDLPKIYQKFDVDIIYNIVDIPGKANVTVKYDNGTVESSKDFTGKMFSKFDGNPKIPDGYKITSITENGKTVATPNDEFEPGGTKIVYVISKIPDRTIKQIMINEKTGLPIVPTESSSVTGYEGEPETITPLKVPTGYKLDSITLGNEQITTKELPNKISTTDETIVYKVSPIQLTFNEKVVEKLPNGEMKAVSQSKTYTVDYGDKTPDVTPTIPVGYHIVEKEDNGTAIASLPKTITKNTTITYVIQKDICKATVKTEYPNGSVVENSSSNQQGLYGSDIKEVPVIPVGYKIKSATVDINGNVTDYTDINKIPKTFEVQPVNITYHLAKEMSSFQVETQYPDGTVVKGSEYQEQGQVGTKVQKISESPVKGYYVKSITIDGKVYDSKEVPTYTVKPQQMVYHLAPIPDNSIVQSVNVINDKTGSIIKVLENNVQVADSYIGNTVKVAPYNYNRNLYTLKSVTIDGKTYSATDYLSHLPNTIDKTTQHIVYNLVMNKGIVNVKTVIKGTGAVVPNSSQTLTGYVDTKVTGEHSVIPAGYRLDNITVDGKVVNNIDVNYTNKAQSIVYNISKIPDNSVIENVNVVQNGVIIKRLVIHKQIAEGYEGQSVKITPYSYDKKMYTLQSVDIDGKQYNSTDYVKQLPSKISDNQQVVTYNLTINKGDVKVETVYKDTGKPVANSNENLTGQIGQKVSGVKPVVPKGYEICGITVDGQPVSQSQVNNLLYGENTQSIVYIIKKMPNNTITETVNIVNTQGKVSEVLVPTHVIADGYEGESDSIKPYNYDKTLYKLQSVIINGKIYTADNYKSFIPKSIGKSEQSIIYNLVRKSGDVVYKTVYQDNNSLVPNSTGEVKGYIGTKAQGITPLVPQGYEITKVTYNGKEISQSAINNIDISNSEGHVVYYVSKIPTSTITTEVKDGNTIVKGSVVNETKEVGKKYDIVNEIVPKGYKLDNILVNGKITPKAKLSDIDFTKDNQTVIYNISKIPTGSISVGLKTVDGQVIINPQTVTGDVGQTVKPIVPQIPKDCRKVGLTLDNKEVSNIDDTITKGNKTYWIIVEKEVEVKVEVKTITGKILGIPIIKRGYQGDELTGIKETIPQGYHLVSETINNKPAKGEPNKFPNENTTIIYTVAPNIVAKGTITQQVVNEEGAPISNEVIFNGNVGSVDNQKIPQYDTKEYHIVKVYVNGKEVPLNEVPMKVTKGVTKIVYVAQKQAVEDTVKVVYENGTQALPTVTYKGEPGGIVNIVEPSMKGKLQGYEIVGLTVDGKKTDELPSVFGKNNETIIFTIAKKEQPKLQPKKDNKPAKRRDIAGTINIKVEVEGTGKVLESAVHTGVIGSPFDTLTIPKGYHLVETTYDNSRVSNSELPTTIQKGNNSIVYVVQKDEDIKPQPPVIKPIPKKQTGEVIIKVITTKGDVIEHAKYEGIVGTQFNPITIPKKDTIDNITVNGETTTNVPTVIEKGKTVIVYTVSQPEVKPEPAKPEVQPQPAKPEVKPEPSKPEVQPQPSKPQNKPDVKPVTPKKQYGNVTVKIVDGNRILYYGTSHEVVGGEISQPSIPQGYKLEGITSTVNGEEEQGIPTKVVKGDTVIIYNVTKADTTKPTVKPNNEPPKIVDGKEEVKVVTVDGKVISDNQSKVPVGTSINKPTIPNGYKIVKVVSTVNGNLVNNIPESVVKGDTVIVYTIQKDEQQKPVTPNKPEVPQTPSKPLVIHHAKAPKPQVKPITPQNKPEVKPVTPQNKPEVKPVQPQKENKPEVKAVQPQKENKPKVKPVTPQHKSEVKANVPIVNNPYTKVENISPNSQPVGGTPQTIESTGNITTNNNNNNSIGNVITNIPTEIHQGYDKLVNDLPHTGLPIGADAGMGAEGLFGLGAIATAIVGALKFKKKNSKKDKEDK